MTTEIEKGDFVSWITPRGEEHQAIVRDTWEWTAGDDPQGPMVSFAYAGGNHSVRRSEVTLIRKRRNVNDGVPKVVLGLRVNRCEP